MSGNVVSREALRESEKAAQPLGYKLFQSVELRSSQVLHLAAPDIRILFLTV